MEVARNPGEIRDTYYQCEIATHENLQPTNTRNAAKTRVAVPPLIAQKRKRQTKLSTITLGSAEIVSKMTSHSGIPQSVRSSGIIFDTSL